MRVAVRHKDESHPNHGWFAFAEGRILGFTNPVTGESYSREQVAEALLKRSKEQFPAADGYEHRIETLHVAGTDKNGNERGEWHPIGESELPLAGVGQTTAQGASTAQGQEGSA